MSNERERSDALLHEICDSDALWGPLVLLRPAPDKPIGHARLLLMCSLFGLFYGMCANAVFAIAHHFGGRHPPAVYAAPLLLALGSFLCGELTLVRAWNRRAQRHARPRRASPRLVQRV
jgi:hypothetical protein